MYALGTGAGHQRWVYKTGNSVESNPAVVGGIVYFGSNDGRIYALNAATGP
jgi:outer membrane protein assembly factor BamB